MKTKFGAIVVDGRGKLGGHFFSKNLGGSFMGSKVTPVNPQSRVQFRRRKFFYWLSVYWRTLTDAQRLAWNNAAQDINYYNVFGDTFKPTGSNLYMQQNWILNELGLTWTSLPKPPICRFKLNSVSLIVQRNPDVFRVTTSPALVSGMALLVYSTFGHSPGKALDTHELHYVRDLATVGGTVFNIQNQVINVMGSMPPLGSKVFVRVQVVDYGYASRGNFLDTFAICEDV